MHVKGGDRGDTSSPFLDVSAWGLLYFENGAQQQREVSTCMCNLQSPIPWPY